MSNEQQGNLKVNTENIFPIIKKFLYSDHEIFLRELVSNAVDACQKVKTLAVAGEITHDGGGLRVEIIADKNAKTLTIRDNGIGMTAAEVEQYINQIAFSGAEEFVSKYKDAQIIGHFGLGFYSAFMVSKLVEIQTLSQRSGSEAVKWSCDGSPNYVMGKGEKSTPGTDIILHLADDSVEFSEDTRINGILTKYCKFMPIEIVFGEKSDWVESEETDEEGKKKEKEIKVANVINNTLPLWIKKPSDLGADDYQKFYRELYPFNFDEPVFHIHINVDYPFNLTGILFFPKMKNNFEVQKNKVQLYCNQVFITDEVKNILPDFLTLLHGVVDSPDIPLNVSRSYLQEDANVKKISSHITKKVSDKLMSMFNQDRKDFEQKWQDIGVFIQYGVLTDEKFAEKANSFTLYKNSDNQYYTLDEFREKVKDHQVDKNGDCVVLYADSVETHFTAISAAKERGYEVIIIDGPLAPHFISQVEQKNEKVKFKRIDSDVVEKLIEKDEELPSVLSEDQKKDIKAALEKFVDTKIYHVEFASLSPNDAPFIITQNEFMRRMKEQSLMGGGGFYGTLPDSYNLVANSNHKLFSETISNAEGGVVLQESKVKQAIDLALLSKGLLKGESLDLFVKRSYSMMTD